MKIDPEWIRTWFFDDQERSLSYANDTNWDKYEMCLDGWYHVDELAEFLTKKLAEKNDGES